MELIETESENPVCPHCGKELQKILAKRITSTFGVRFVYFCSKCKKTLGISHRKGFWMG
jgi:DNA-directed RNA polymerase subunit RPC12/RpoP